jgi:hypothetical protein
MTPQLRFQRFEFKYLLTEKLVHAVREAILPHMRIDDHVGSSGQDMYEVISLYYDTPGLRYYCEKVDGINARKKVRLRTYRNSGELSDSVFLEIKRKQGPVILKDRCRFLRTLFEESRGDIRLILDRSGSAVPEDFRDEYLYEEGIGALRPTALVVYDREPYVGIDHPKLRVTFDRSIRSREDDRLLVDDAPFVDCSHGFVVMEIKYQGALPWFLRDIIASSNLQHVAYSKYCKGIEANYAITERTLWT